MLSSSLSCPIATQDVSINLKNRNNAFAKFGYGPPNPDESNDAFWLKKAKMYNSPTNTIKGMRCGNCAAFIQTPKMMECIIGGLEKDEVKNELSYDENFVKAANLGYCDLFQFTCAAARTCDAWKSGGPITKEKIMMYGKPKTPSKAPPKKGVPVTIMVAVGKPKLPVRGQRTATHMKSGRGK